LLGLFFGVQVLGVSVGICFGAYVTVISRKWIFLSVMLWIVFLFWQLVPVLASEMNPGFDGRNLLRFPLRFSAFFLMSAAYGVADPFALVGILWHAAIGVGVSIARPDLAWWAALALAISVMMNLLFNRLVFAWLERVLAKRRTREIVTAISIVLFLCVQFSSVILQRRGSALRHALENSASVWRALPPALAGTVLERAANGDSAAALGTAGLLGIYALGFGGLFALRVRAQFTGEDLGESAAPVRQKPLAKHVPVPLSRTGVRAHLRNRKRARSRHFRQGDSIFLPKHDADDERFHAADSDRVLQHDDVHAEAAERTFLLWKIWRQFRISRLGRLHPVADDEFLPQ
jgi:ABC-2 type transport system permease protein